MACLRLHHTPFLLLIAYLLQMTLISAWIGTMPSRSSLVTLRGHQRLGTPHSFLSHQLFSSSVDQQHDHEHDGQEPLQLQNIAIVGGGLAGLSTAYHLLEKTQARDNNSRCRVTIFDTAPVGTAGASSVAGGLIHPLSPRGKLVHWGEEGVEATNRLVAVAEAANDAEAANNNNSDDKQLPPPTQIVVRDQLYRLAVTDKHVEQLQATARNSTLAQYCTWKTTDELIQAGVITSTEVAAGAFDETETTVLGALCLHSGCCLLHVPSYLQGLWAACRGRGATWEIVGNDEMNNVADWKKRLQDFDAVVLSAGSGLFSTPTHKKDSGTNSTSSSLLSRSDFPLQLVRGQSVEIRVPDHVHEDDDVPSQALLCGKYVSPMPGDPNLYLVGATHEFQEDALSGTAVKAELQKLTEQFSSRLWKNATVERWTSGYRVQSERGQLGRLPMIGRLATTSTDDADTNTQIHTNVWIFTGLSSRGLLYHALYGDILTDALLAGSEAPMLRRGKELTWWKKKLNSGGIR